MSHRNGNWGQFCKPQSIDRYGTYRKFHSGRRAGGGSQAPVSPETLPAQDSRWIKSIEGRRLRGRRLGDASYPLMLGVRGQRLSPWDIRFVSFWHRVGLQGASSVEVRGDGSMDG